MGRGRGLFEIPLEIDVSNVGKGYLSVAFSPMEKYCY